MAHAERLVARFSQPSLLLALTRWAATRTLADACRCLQAVGVAAGPVVSATGLLDDSHLVATGFWQTLERRFVGSHVLPSPPYLLDGRSPPLNGPAPTLGQHTAEVLQQVLGLSPLAIERLQADAIIGTLPV